MDSRRYYLAGYLSAWMDRTPDECLPAADDLLELLETLRCDTPTSCSPHDTTTGTTTRFQP